MGLSTGGKGTIVRPNGRRQQGCDKWIHAIGSSNGELLPMGDGKFTASPEIFPPGGLTQFQESHGPMARAQGLARYRSVGWCVVLPGHPPRRVREFRRERIIAAT
jgi:hypothetical protein